VRSRTWRVASITVGLLTVLVACTGSAPETRPDRSDAIVVAAFNFTESEILAEIYAQALEAEGYPARPVANAGPRELVIPALVDGLVDLVPEYAGSGLSFVTLGVQEGSASAGETHEALARAVEPLGLIALRPARAQDANAIVVTQVTADRFGLREITDLAAEAPRLVFGGPPECAHRQQCLVGLESEYGLRFREFIPLDTGGPLTVQALRSGSIDVALLFTTDPAIASEGFVVLTDDRGLQPAENVTPLLRRQVVIAYGNAAAETLDAVSAQLSTADVRAMIEDVTAGRSAHDAAASWLRDHGLT
jgi:osmoprotectant transport system substrate-binding protein